MNPPDLYRCKHCSQLAPVLDQVTWAQGRVIHARHCGLCGRFWGLARRVCLAAKIALAEAERDGKTAVFSN